MPEPLTLAAHASKGDGHLWITGPLPRAGWTGWIRIAAGTPYWEDVPVYRRMGDGPYLVHLGLQNEIGLGMTHAHLMFAHCAGEAAEWLGA